uniref:Immunoglobulin domain-containing protein n=1 Tax=Sinocyclocheilus anshuiensis TaxID=1608454 RepID=A0A671KQA2_9TELE
MITSGSINLNMYEISVKIGEELKLDVLLSDADKVQHQSRRSKKWKEVWKRGHGVQNHQLDDRDGNLTINNFTANDSGTYRVLGSAGEILITVTVEAVKNKKEREEKHVNILLHQNTCNTICMYT